MFEEIARRVYAASPHTDEDVDSGLVQIAYVSNFVVGAGFDPPGPLPAHTHICSYEGQMYMRPETHEGLIARFRDSAEHVLAWIAGHEMHHIVTGEYGDKGREFEAACDREGVEYARKAGFEFKHMLRFWDPSDSVPDKDHYSQAERLFRLAAFFRHHLTSEEFRMFWIEARIPESEKRRIISQTVSAASRQTP